MKIILRFLLRNIREKKLRSFLVVFAIAISSALFFATAALGTNLEMAFEKMFTKESGNAEIVMEPDWQNWSAFRINKLKQLNHRLEYAVGVYTGMSAVYKDNNEDVQFSLMGIDQKDINTIYDLQYVNNTRPSNFEGRKVIIGKAFAEDNNIKVNDKIALEVYGNKVRFVVAAIAYNTGPFMKDRFQNISIIPRNLAAKYNNQLGRVNKAYIKLNEGESIPEMITALQELYPHNNFRPSAPEDQINEWVSSITIPYRVMIFLILATSAFIIFTSFQVITRERLPVIGTFRSIGATRRATSWLFYGESLFYGIIGGILGLIIGIGILYLLGISTTKSYMPGDKFIMYFNIQHVAGSMIAAVLLSLISSILPIRSLRKISTKDIILNNIKSKKDRPVFKIILGICFLNIALLVPRFAPPSLALIANMGCLLLAIAALLLIAPLITYLFTKLLARPFSLLFGNMGGLAIKNLKGNKKMQNNIALLTIGIATLLMITTISTSLNTHLLQLFNRADFQLFSWIWPMNRNVENKIRAIDGVESTLGTYDARQIQLTDRNESLTNIRGVNSKYYLEFWQDPVDQKLLNKLDEGRNIILSSLYKNKLNVRIGDVLPLNWNGRERFYRIIGFYHTMWNGGEMSLISDKYMKMDNSSNRYDNLYIKTSLDPDEIEKRLKETFSRVNPWVTTVESQKKANLESNGQMMNMLTGFSIMAMLIGVIGIFNNFFLAFIDRKRDLALFKSQGMSNRQMIRMILVEAFAEGLLGAIIGIIGGFLMLLIVPWLMQAMGLYLPLKISAVLCLTFLIIGTIITLIAAVSPAIKSSKMNTISALKYE